MIERATIYDILTQVPSGLGLDISKNHTGIIVWDGKEIKDYGFALESRDRSDYFAEYRMRLEFKENLSAVIGGMQFSVIIVEDVYGGENFDTVRKLLALNTVIDELIFERKVICDEFFRWNEPMWLSNARLLYKQRGKLKAKIETQGILEFLQWDYYLTHKDDTIAQKKEIFFEDKCDACGMLLGVCASKLFKPVLTEKSNLKLSDIKMFYCESEEQLEGMGCKRIEEGVIYVDVNLKSLEKSIIQQVELHPKDLLCAVVPPNKLGAFGIKHKFTFFDAEVGYLVFHKK